MHFYLCAFVASDSGDHDDDVDDVSWLRLDAARTQLTYTGESDMIERVP